jgi:hypothetical protein
MRSILQASMSRTDLLLQCQWPFGRELEKEPAGEEAKLGTEVHAVLAKRLQGGEAKCKSLEIHERSAEAMAVLVPWLRGENPWRRSWLTGGKEVEVSYGWRNGKGRKIAPPSEDTHTYPDVFPQELPGTVDLALTGAGLPLVVLDHKTGREVGPPAESGQLMSQALPLLKPHHKRIILAYGHYPADGDAQVIADEVSRDDLNRHAAKLKTAMAKIGDGSLRPGSWCKLCPALRECPTQTSALAELKAPQGMVLSAQKAGAIHETLAHYDGLKRKLQEQIQDWVTENGPAIRPDGKVVDWIERPYSALSQASIKKAYGPEEGTAVLEKLEADGALTRGVRKEFRAINDT